MMSWRSLVFFIIFVTIKATKQKDDFDVDYYFSSPLRSTDKCDKMSKLYCQLYCETKNSLCISGKCYCMSIKEAAVAESLPVLNEENLLYAYRPTVRHHIAHFCPNLDVARQCIRKCMQLGLPSFCGKDHVCYCGHKYKNTDMNPKTNAEEVYNQFKDLYTKYFGPDTRSKNPQDHIDE